MTLIKPVTLKVAAAILGVLLVIALAFAGAALIGPSDEEKAQEVAQGNLAACETALGEAADTLTALEEELDGSGVNYDEHTEYLDDARDQRGTILSGELPESCETLVLEPMSEALDEYEIADAEWYDCIYDYSAPSCSAPSVDAIQQSAWVAAEDAIEEMNTGRQEMRKAAGLEVGESLPQSSDATDEGAPA